MKHLITTHGTRTTWLGFGLLSVALVVASWRGWVPMTMTEVLAFISGVVTVWLVVKENIWNWPIGILNSAFFVAVFWNARLFADMGLQAVYIVLGILGWYWWLKGGKNRTALTITRTSWSTWAVLATLTTLSTYGATLYLRSVNDAAPFWDALTTVLSLVAQYLLTKKKIENWLVWITADVIYIALYFYKDLYLTSGLYIIFLLMCVAGWRAWKKTALKGDGSYD